MPKIASTSLFGEEKYFVANPDTAPVLIDVIESPSSLANNSPLIESKTRTEDAASVVKAI